MNESLSSSLRLSTSVSFLSGWVNLLLQMHAASETLSKGWESSKKAMKVGRDLMAIAGFDNSQLLQARCISNALRLLYHNSVQQCWSNLGGTYLRQALLREFFDIHTYQLQTRTKTAVERLVRCRLWSHTSQIEVAKNLFCSSWGF